MNLLSGCAANITEVQQDSHHHKIYGIDCSGYAIPMNVCYNDTAKLCPKGYSIIANDARTPFENMCLTGSLNAATWQLAGQISESIPGVKKGIRIKCN